MNIQQRFEAIQVIKQYATITGRTCDGKGGFCALGALAFAANGFKVPWPEDVLDKLQRKFGLTLEQSNGLVPVNDYYHDPLQRRAALVAINTMNVSQRFLAIQAIKKYASIIGEVSDGKGNYCAYGALMIGAGLDASGFDIYSGEGRNIDDHLQLVYGLNSGQLSGLVNTNDQHQDPLVRREKLVEYLEAIPLTQ